MAFVHSFYRIVLALFLLGAWPGSGRSSVVTLSAENALEMRVHFTAPAQPPQHNAIQLSPINSLITGPFVSLSKIFENDVLLGSGTKADSLSGRFADATSFFAPSSNSVIAFSTIADGVSDGLITLKVVSGVGTVTIDTSSMQIMTFGDSGGFSSFFPTITQIEVVAAVSEPASSILLFGLLLTLGAVRRGRVHTEQGNQWASRIELPSWTGSAGALSVLTHRRGVASQKTQTTTTA